MIPSTCTQRRQRGQSVSSGPPWPTADGRRSRQQTPASSLAAFRGGGRRRGAFFGQGPPRTTGLSAAAGTTGLPNDELLELAHGGGGRRRDPDSLGGIRSPMDGHRDGHARRLVCGGALQLLAAERPGQAAEIWTRQDGGPADRSTSSSDSDAGQAPRMGRARIDGYPPATYPLSPQKAGSCAHRAQPARGWHPNTLPACQGLQTKTLSLPQTRAANVSASCLATSLVAHFSPVRALDHGPRCASS